MPDPTAHASAMKVLLTGATGFVGSHVLDELIRQGIPTAALLRASSNRRFIRPHLDKLDLREGAIDDPDSLGAALRGITHVIHCAGSVKALTREGFFESNAVGTRNVIEAANAAGVRRVVHISSLAAAGPATSARPAREDDTPQPVSDYGHSVEPGLRGRPRGDPPGRPESPGGGRTDLLRGQPGDGNRPAVW